MPHLAVMLLLLVVSPALIFMLHAVIHRALDVAGQRPTAHASAAVAIFASFLVLLASLWWLAVPDGASSLDLACVAAYASVVYAGLAVLYVDVVNIAETSVHMHLLLELAWSGGLPIVDLQERYSADRMIAARLERLTGMGQLRVVDGRCHLGSGSALRFNACVDVWRVVLGLPTDPSDVTSGSEA